MIGIIPHRINKPFEEGLFVKTTKLNIRIVQILSLFNVLLLCYTAWQKHYSLGCASCNQVFFFPVNSVTLALLGAVSSLILGILSLIYMRSVILKILLVIIVSFSTIVAVFLQAAQFIQMNNFCYLCFSAAIVFYIIFCLLLYEIVIKNIWNRFIRSTEILS